jgi:hypothetical protein
MNADFLIGTQPDALLDEPAARAAVAEGQLPDADPILMGRIVLQHEGQPAVTLRDDLQFLVPALCLKAPATLKAQGRVEVAMASRPARVELLLEGEEVRVIDPAAGELAHYPRAALWAALQGCATRFADYAGLLAQQDARWSPLHQSLRAQVDAGT